MRNEEEYTAQLNAQLQAAQEDRDRRRERSRWVAVVTLSGLVIAFVALAETGGIDGTTAGEHKNLFEEWQAGVSYKVGQYRRYGEKLYRCVQQHTSQAGWEPDKAASLWSVAADPAEEWPEWSQPLGAHDAYAKGAKVSHNGKHWVSDVDANVWEPGVSGWSEAKE